MVAAWYVQADDGSRTWGFSLFKSVAFSLPQVSTDMCIATGAIPLTGTGESNSSHVRFQD